MNDNKAVDIVYTWVDGSYDGYRKSLEAHSDNPTDLNPERYRDHSQMLRYSLRSVHANLRCDYRRIYIVTQRPQVPPWLDTDHPRIRLVHHDEIFENPDHLPTFSSNAIELQLHRIPDLADRFIYFCDDFLLGGEVRPEHLMDRQGGPLYGPGSDHNRHLPHLVVRRHIEQMLTSRPEVFDELLRQRFRCSNYYPLDDGYQDFLVQSGLGAPYSKHFLRRHRLIWRLGDNAETDWNPLDSLIQSWFGCRIGQTTLWLWLTRAILAYCRWARVKFICLNDDMGKIPNPRLLRVLQQFLEKTFPTPSPYERPP